MKSSFSLTQKEKDAENIRYCPEEEADIVLCREALKKYVKGAEVDEDKKRQLFICEMNLTRIPYDSPESKELQLKQKLLEAELYGVLPDTFLTENTRIYKQYLAQYNSFLELLNSGNGSKEIAELRRVALQKLAVAKFKLDNPTLFSQ